ncbi:hypothetical protein PUN28_019127 [Cardiocondyla obscurior]|uniref:Uncharacterized protein n=1 Tax=Cardiocondyla obscurior TaxID=286306 RepID=A0AAW2EHP7_9HYME
MRTGYQNRCFSHKFKTKTKNRIIIYYQCSICKRCCNNNNESGTLLQKAEDRHLVTRAPDSTSTCRSRENCSPRLSSTSYLESGSYHSTAARCC